MNSRRDKLVEIFRPYLHLYFIRKYSVSGTDKYNNAHDKLKSKLRKFVDFNYCFGRKIIKLIRKSTFYFTHTKQPKFLKEYYINIKYPSYHTGNTDIHSILEYKIPREKVCDDNRRMFIDLLLDTPRRQRGYSIHESLISNIMNSTISRLNNPINNILDIDDIIDTDTDTVIDTDTDTVIDVNIDINHNADENDDDDDEDDDVFLIPDSQYIHSDEW